MQRKTSGLIALILAALAVGIALIAGVWRDRPAAPEESRALEQQLDLNVRAMQDTLADRVGEKTGGEKQERLDSPRGQALFRRCVDWTELLERSPTADNRAGRDRACDAYRDYVLTGETPD